MSLSELSGDVLKIVFTLLCNPLKPCCAVDFSSASCGIWTQTQALRQQLKAAHEAAAVLCKEFGFLSCKELRVAKVVDGLKYLSAADLVMLERLERLGGSVLPAFVVQYLTRKLFRRNQGSRGRSISVAGLATLGSLGSVLPALKDLWLCESSAGSGPDFRSSGVQRLAAAGGGAGRGRAAGRDLPRH